MRTLNVGAELPALRDAHKGTLAYNFATSESRFVDAHVLASGLVKQVHVAICKLNLPDLRVFCALNLALLALYG